MARQFRILPGSTWAWSSRPSASAIAAGWPMSTLVDGHFWLTYSEILPDEKCLTCAEFVRRAPACFRGHGITTIEHVM